MVTASSLIQNLRRVFVANFDCFLNATLPFAKSRANGLAKKLLILATYKNLRNLNFVKWDYMYPRLQCAHSRQKTLSLIARDYPRYQYFSYMAD